MNRSVHACGSFEPNRIVGDTHKGETDNQINAKFLHENVEASQAFKETPPAREQRTLMQITETDGTVPVADPRTTL